MAKASSSSPATKADLENLWKRIEKHFKNSDQQFHDLRLHFDIAVENMYHDFRGAFDDKTAQYKDEVTDLKKRVGAIERRLRFSRR